MNDVSLAAVELWQVDTAGLSLQSAFYGSHTELLRASMGRRFAPGEGLPGRVLQTRLPELCSLTEASFARYGALGASDISAALAWPFAPSGTPEMVVVLLFAPGAATLAAELWAPDALGTLSRAQGLYRNLEDFERRSRGTRFAVLEGLPSLVFDQKDAALLEYLSAESGFVRAEAAAAAGLSAALGLPVTDGDKVKAALVLFLSEVAPPVAAAEHWQVEKNRLRLSAGIYGPHGGLSLSAGHTLGRGEDLAGHVYEHKRPLLMTSLAPGGSFVRAEAASAAGLRAALGLPVMRGSRVVSVVTLMI